MKFLSLVFLFLSLNIFAEEALLNTNRFDQNTNDIKIETQTIKSYPGLKKFLFEPPKSNFYLGFGASPIGFVGEKYMPTISLFQFHWITDRWDVEIFSANLGRYFSSNKFSNGAFLFNARTAPKFKLFRKLFNTFDLSVGPMLALEVVRFGKVDVSIQDPVTLQGTNPLTPFKLSKFGLVFGLSVSQTFHLKSGKKFKLTQSLYSQRYDVKKNGDQFEYRGIGDSAGLFTGNNTDLDEIDKARVLSVEFSYLY